MRKHGSSFDYLPNATVESLNLPPKVFFLIMRRHPGVTDITAVILFFRRIIILDKPAVPAESTGATEQALRNPATDGAYRDVVLFGNEAYGDQCHVSLLSCGSKKRRLTLQQHDGRFGRIFLD